MARIFISHSAKDDFAKKVRQRLVAKLRRMKLEPYVDEGIIAGDLWRAKLHIWLGCCDGAVILFSRDALRSEWVKKEATILSWRRSLHPGLLIVPVRLGDVSQDELTQGDFASLELGEMQTLSCGIEDEKAIDRLIGRIVLPFKGMKRDSADSGFGDWVAQVAMRLEAANPRGLEKAAQILGIEERDWLGFGDRASALAHHLLHVGLEDSALEALAEMMSWMTSLEAREGLLRWVWFLWVQEEKARQILPICQRAERERIVAINAEEQDTGRCYIRRATCGTSSAILVTASGTYGEGSAAEVLRAFRRAVERATGSEKHSSARRGRSLREPSVVKVFFVLRREEVQREVINALREEYPKATLILLSGSLPLECADLGLPQLTIIQPKFEGEEADGLARVGELQAMVGVEGSEWKRRQL